jgi:hypothetical protein
MLATTATRRTTTAAMAAAKMKTKVAPAVVWFVACPCCFVLGSHAEVPQKIGLQQQNGDCRKGLFKTNQLIAFNQGKSVGFNKILITLISCGNTLFKRMC